MTPHRRRLPHDYRDGRPLFLTWHLHGSLPQALYPPADKRNAGRAFVWMDRHLDTTRTGPLYLKQKHIAELVATAIRRGSEELGHYNLEAYVVMANHVHLLVVPYISPTRFLQSLIDVREIQCRGAACCARSGKAFAVSENNTIFCGYQ